MYYNLNVYPKKVIQIWLQGNINKRRYKIINSNGNDY